jgi:TonB-linked SusC/RagA family outer membrane protein
VAWRVSNEDFLKDLDIIDEFKIRASYGETGNQAVDAYSSIARINTGQSYYYDGTTPSVSTPLGAPAPQDLRWEVSKQTDIGVDASLYKGRLRFTADWYNKDITNLLYTQQAPFYFGGQNYQTNLGELNNSGFEFSAGGTPINKGNFKWNSSFNISFNKNKVVNLGSLDEIRVGDVSLLKVGEPLGEMVGYEFLGTWKTNEAAEAALFGMVPGDAKFTDLNGDKVYNTDDNMSIGNGSPEFSYGFINDFSYKNWTASVMIQGVSGGDIYSRTQAYIWGGQGQARHPTIAEALNMWTPSNETENPHYSTTTKNFLESSRYVYDGSYLRLKNLLIAYHLPEKMLSKTSLSNVEIYVSGQNLFTITSYPGYDPEVTNSNEPLTIGTEWGNIPNSTTYTIGCRIGF